MERRREDSELGNTAGGRGDGYGCAYGGRRRRSRSVDAREIDRGGERERGERKIDPDGSGAYLLTDEAGKEAGGGARRERVRRPRARYPTGERKTRTGASAACWAGPQLQCWATRWVARVSSLPLSVLLFMFLFSIALTLF